MQIGGRCQKNRSVAAHALRPTFLVGSIANRRASKGTYRRPLFLAERLLAFRFGERFDFLALFFLVAISIGSWRNEHHMQTNKR